MKQNEALLRSKSRMSAKMQVEEKQDRGPEIDALAGLRQASQAWTFLLFFNIGPDMRQGSHRT
jgi:hypothetical protein